MQAEITAAARKQYAEQVGVNEQYLYQCLKGDRDMAPATARRIEAETNGALHRRMLCQTTWHEIWPELAANDAQA